MVRYTKRITPDETNDFYREGDFINYTLPQNIIDLHSIAKYFTAEVDPYRIYADNTFLKRFLPTNSSCIIDYLQIKRDGEIVQTINEYALLNQMNVDVQDDYHKNSDGDKSDTVGFHKINGDTVEKTHDIINTNVIEKYDYCISKWIGFLNGSTRYLDCRGKHVQITIRLSPKYITYRGIKIITPAQGIADTYPEDYHYKISKCFMNMSVIDNENLEIDNKIFFKDFTHFKNQKTRTSKNMIVKGRTNKNIDYILATCTDIDRKTDTGLQLQHYNEDEVKFGNLVSNNTGGEAQLVLLHQNATFSYENYSSDLGKILDKPNQLNNSIYFKRNGIDIGTNQFRVNGIEISPLYTPLETFNNVKSFFETQFTKANNLTSFVNDFYMSVQDYKNTDNGISDVEWLIHGEGRNVGGEGHLFLVHNSSIQF